MKIRMKFYKLKFYRVQYEKMLTGLFKNNIRPKKAGIQSWFW